MSTPVQDDRSVRLVRRISAAPSAVYRAWLEPALVRQWLAPGVQVSSVAIDERVGGAYIVRHTDGNGDVGGFESEIVELVPNSRIVFRWGFAGPASSEGPVFDSVLTVSLRPDGENATELTLVHDHLGELFAAMPAVAEQVLPGWDLVVGNLSELLEKDY